MSTIPAPTLVGECDRFLAAYPWVWGLEAAHGLPRGLLLAVGSRETNLTNEVGDGGHGHGVWQLDDRSHVIPAGFDADVVSQGLAAAVMLHNLLALEGGSVDRAACRYNSGQPLDAYTTGGDYGVDVAGRLGIIQGHYPPAVLPAQLPTGEVSMFVAYANSDSKDGTIKTGWTYVVRDRGLSGVSTGEDRARLVEKLGWIVPLSGDQLVSLR